MQSKGDLVKLPSLPTVYDYELNPQKVCGLTAVLEQTGDRSSRAQMTLPPEFAGSVLIRVPR